MNSTLATVIINDTDKQQAQSDMGEQFFNTPLSPTGELPATNWMSSGWFLNQELDKICNNVTWIYKIAFGNDWKSSIDNFGLKIISEYESE